MRFQVACLNKSAAACLDSSKGKVWKPISEFSVLPSAVRVLQDAQYFTGPNAWSFRDAWQVFIGDTWERQAGVNPYSEDAGRIEWVKDTSQTLKPYTVGNYINRKPPPCQNPAADKDGAETSCLFSEDITNFSAIATD